MMSGERLERTSFATASAVICVRLCQLSSKQMKRMGLVTAPNVIEQGLASNGADGSRADSHVGAHFPLISLFALLSMECVCRALIKMWEAAFPYPSSNRANSLPLHMISSKAKVNLILSTLQCSATHALTNTASDNP